MNIHDDGSPDKIEHLEHLGISPPKCGSCPRGPVIELGRDDDPMARQLARLNCDCNTCESCLPRRAYRFAVRAARCASRAVADGEQLAIALVPTSRNGRHADRQERRRRRSTGAALCRTYGEWLLSLAAYPSGETLPGRYTTVEIAEALGQLGSAVRSLCPSDHHERGARGEELFGLRDAWADVEQDEPNDWRLLRRLRSTEQDAAFAILAAHGIEARMESGAQWRLAWKYPSGMTQDQIDTVEGAIGAAHKTTRSV